MLGVHRAEQTEHDYTPTYIPRDVDSEINRALAKPGFILIVGESASGKSRSAYEAMRRRLTNHRLLLPTPHITPDELLRVFAKSRRCVLWLDDLERYLGMEGLTEVMLAEAKVVHDTQRYVIATMRSREFARFAARQEDSVSSEERIDLRQRRTAIDQATLISIPRLWSQEELRRAEKAAGDHRIAQALSVANRFGLAEILADGPELLLDWQNAWAAGAHPRAAAIVAAAVDCRRAGMRNPIPRGTLEALHEQYLSARGGHLLRPERFGDALAWASAPARGTTSLLIEERKDHYVAFDYLVDRIPRAENVSDIPENVWQAALRSGDAAEAYSVGVAAQHNGRLSIAAQAFRLAFDGGVPEAGARLADSLGELGQLQEAVAASRAAAAQATQHWGQTHSESINAKRTLVHWLNEAGLLREAMELCRQLLLQSTDELGPDSPETIAVRYQLGLTAGLLGDPRRAAELLAEVVEARTRVLGEDDPETLLARSVYARWIGESGRPHEATELYRQLEQDRTRVFGADDPRTLHTRARLAYWTSQAGDPDAALELYRQLLTDRAQVLGTDHQHTLHTRSRVALWTALTGDPSAAVHMFRSVIADRTRILGSEHPATLISRLLLGRCLGESGHLQEAVAECAAVADDYGRLLGPNHPDSLAARMEYARWIGESGRVDDAAAMLSEAASDCSRQLGTQHPLTLAIRNNAAYWVEGAGGDAVAAYSTLVDDCTTALGENHPNTLLTRRNLAHCLGGVGRVTEAVEVLDDVVARYVRTLGTEHPDSQAARASLAHWRGEPALSASPKLAVQSAVTTSVESQGPLQPVRTVVDGLAYEPYDMWMRKRP